MIAGPVVAALNHLLGQAAWARARLVPFAGRCASFVMPPWRLDMAVTEAGTFAAISAEEAEIDVTVALPADSPLQALNGVERIMAAAHVTGNAEFATELSFVLKNLRWDVEEDLSRLVGDVAAHRIAGAMAALADWQKRSADNLAQNVVEYLSEESRILVPAHELAELRRDREGLEARIAALESRIGRLR